MTGEESHDRSPVEILLSISLVFLVIGFGTIPFLDLAGREKVVLLSIGTLIIAGVTAVVVRLKRQERQ